MNKNIILKITCLLAIVLLVGTIGAGIGQADNLTFQLGIRNGVAPVGEFRADVNGVDVRFDWSAMLTADSYTMAVALSDEFGNPDMGSLALLDMGPSKTFSTSGLPSGMIFYAAILGHTAQGPVVSNSLKFMPFAGVTTYPESGDVLMQLSDPGGIGELTIYGNRSGDDIAITRITGDDGTGQFVLTFVGDEPGSFTKGDLIIDFTARTARVETAPIIRFQNRTDSAAVDECQAKVNDKMKTLKDEFLKKRDAIDGLIALLNPAEEVVTEDKFQLGGGTGFNFLMALGKNIDKKISRLNRKKTKLVEEYNSDNAKLLKEYEDCSNEPEDPVDPVDPPGSHTPVILDLQKFIKDITDDFDELFAAYNKCPATANQPDFKKLRIELGVGTLYCGYKSGVRKDLQIDLGSGDGWARFMATYNNDGSISASYHTHETQLSVRFFGPKCTYIRLFKEEPLYSPYMLRYVNPQDPDSNIIFEQNIFMDGGGKPDYRATYDSNFTLKRFCKYNDNGKGYAWCEDY